MEPEAEFQMVTFLEPQIADCPPLGFPNLDNSESPRWDSDISDSCPPSPSPLSSPSPRSSASSSESGIEDGSDMEEAIPTSSQTANGLILKMENPSSPLNALNQPPVHSKKKRKGYRRTQNDSNVLEELNKLLVETMETRVSLASALMDHSGSQIYQTASQISPLDDVMASVQTTASPTSVSHSCPQTVQVSQTTTVIPTSHHVSASSQSTPTVTIPKLSTPPPFASPSRIKNKNARNPRKSDEPKIVIIEEPEEVFAFNISENRPILIY